MVSPKVSIVILNWNGWQDTVECLASVFRIKYFNYNVIVLDNCSKDDSIDKIKKYCEDTLKIKPQFFEYNTSSNPIKVIEYTKNETALRNDISEKFSSLPLKRTCILIKNKRNYGFAKGNNIGMHYAMTILNSKYIFLLNNDTTVDRNCLTDLVKTAESNEGVGSFQPLLLRPGGDIIDSLGQEMVMWHIVDRGINSNYLDFLKTTKGNSEIFGACGAAVLYRSESLKKIGLFDEDFFVIYEDVDLSWRIRLGGFTSLLVPKAIVYHKRGISGAELSNTKIKPLKRYHINKNWLLIVMRYYSLYAILHIILRFPRHFFVILCRCMYYALKLEKCCEFLGIFIRCLKIRKNVRLNPLLHSIQRYWIKLKAVDIANKNHCVL